MKGLRLLRARRRREGIGASSAAPMRLTSPDGVELELTIMGYQFPDNVDDWYDSNWLRIRIRVQDPRGSWEATNPCLETFEAGQLAVWLEAVAVEAPMINREFSKESGRSPHPEIPLRLFDSIDFTEPNLRFDLVERAGDEATVRVHFGFEARPPWAPMTSDPEDVCIDLRLSTVALKTAAQALKAALRVFPVRAAH